MDMLSEWHGCRMRQFYTLDAAGEQIQCRFLAGYRSWTPHSLQMKSSYRATMLGLLHLPTDSPTKLHEIAPVIMYRVALTITLLTSSPSLSPPLPQLWLRPGLWQLPRWLLWQVLSGSCSRWLTHCIACLCVTAEADSSSLLSLGVSVPCRCLSHSCQSSFDCWELIHDAHTQ